AVRETPFAIASTDALPGQALGGAPVTLSWSITGGSPASISGGEIAQPLDVPVAGTTVVHPAGTSTYTLTAFNRPGRTPASMTAQITARVLTAPSIAAFAADP